jgi:hypothetical protein
MIFLGVMLEFLAFYLYRETMKMLLTIDDHSLTIQRSFSSRSILLADIEGYRRGDKNRLYLVLKSGGQDFLVPDPLQKNEELLEWIKEKYTDLDARRFEEETKSILENDQYGGTPEERETRLKGARQVARVGIGVSFVLFLLMIFLPKPTDEDLMIVLFVIPLAGIYGLWYFKGLLRLSVKKGSAYPSAFFPLCLPVFAGWISVLTAYRLYPIPASAWQTIVIMAVILAAVCILAGKEALAAEKNRVLGYVFILLLAGIYSYNLLIFSNCNYDKSAAEKYRVQVTDKTVSRGKSTTYFLHLSPWGTYTNGEKESVPSSFYYGVGMNDSVSVYLKPGKWNIPWYRVVKQ